MNSGILYYAVGWTVVVAFAVTLFITLGALVGLWTIQRGYLHALFVKLVLEVVAAALFLFYRGPGEVFPPYSGEWHGTVYWTDDWAMQLMNPSKSNPDFIPINPRAEGEIYIYRAPNGIYKGFSTWTVKNSETSISEVAVLARNFSFDPNGSLHSLDVTAHTRRNLIPSIAYGPSPVYTWTFEEVTSTRMKASMTTNFGGQTGVVVGQVILEHN